MVPSAVSTLKRPLFMGRTVDGGLRQNKDLIVGPGHAVNLVIALRLESGRRCCESGRCSVAAATPQVAARPALTAVVSVQIAGLLPVLC